MLKQIVYGSLLLMVIGVACKTDGATKAKDDIINDSRPNIVVIMADDLGYSDLGCYGGEISTPNLDKLGNNGLRFSSFYNTSRCCPSRASMLTGLYPHQAGIGRMTMDIDLPGYRGTLGENTVTIAEVLKDAGYQTGMTGKWHVSPTNRLEEDKQLKWLAHQENYGTFSDTLTYPTFRGFDKYYGNIWGVIDYFDPFSLVNGLKQVENVPPGYYHTDAIGDSAVAYVEQFSKNKSPFFLYVAHCAPHWPLHAPEEEIEKYASTYNTGWREIRRNRYQGLIDKGIIRTENAKMPDFMFPELDWESNPNAKWDSRAMAVHAAMVDRMDQSIGKLVDKLEATGELANTVIFFFSDNGASSERPSKYGPGFDRAGSTRDGREVVFPVQKDSMPGAQTVHSGIGPEWAHIINTPFRFWKAKSFEGGINSPFIVHWPSKVTDKGIVKDNPAHVVDIMATCIDLANTSYPKNYKGHVIKPTVGKSMLPILMGKSTEGTQEVYFWEHFGAAALRKKEWKLVRLDKDGPWELYNLAKDRTEINNVAESNPKIVQELKKEWEDLAQKYEVYPAPN
ncbi:arylsulfatase [Arenibacter palladensis]|uniref:arylsulfatase n=1 Tax=Arenibacter palladensis TaxID=237373 RepID=UPI002FD72586